FHVPRVGKHVDRVEAVDAPAFGGEARHIAREGGGIAGDVDDAGGLGAGQCGHEGLGAGAGRIEDDGIPWSLGDGGDHVAFVARAVLAAAQGGGRSGGGAVVIDAGDADAVGKAEGEIARAAVEIEHALGAFGGGVYAGHQEAV